MHGCLTNLGNNLLLLSFNKNEHQAIKSKATKIFLNLVQAEEKAQQASVVLILLRGEIECIGNLANYQ